MYWGGLIDIIAYARVVILLHLCLLEQCLDPVFRTSIKTCNFVTFYKFLIHVGVHHTKRADVKALENAKTGKVTAVVMVMHLYGNTKSRSINDNVKKSAKKTKLKSKSKKLNLN